MGNVTVTLSGDASRLTNALQRAIAAEERLKAAADDVGTATERGAQRGAASLQSMASQASSTLLGISSAADIATKAVDLLRAGFDAVRDAQREAFASHAPAWASGELAQLAGGSASRLAELEAQAKELFAAGAVGTLPEAQQLQFAMTSAGLTSAADRRTIADLASLGVIGQPGETVQGIGALRIAFGEKRAGSAASLFGAAQAAAAPSSEGVPEVLQAAGSIASMAASAGVSPQELLASIGVLSATAPAAEAATQVKSLLGFSAKSGGLGGGTLLGSLSRFKGMTPSQLVGEVKDVEARQAVLGLLAGESQVRALMSGGEAETAGTIAARMAQPSAVLEREARASRARSVLMAERDATSEQVREVVAARFDEDLRKRGMGQFGRWYMSSWVKSAQALADVTGAQQSDLARQLGDQPLQQQLQLAERAADAAVETARNTRPTRLVDPIGDR